MTQQDIYEICRGIQPGGGAAIIAARDKGPVAYDHQECWYRPIADIGKPLDMALYRKYYP